LTEDQIIRQPWDAATIDRLYHPNKFTDLNSFPFAKPPDTLLCRFPSQLNHFWCFVKPERFAYYQILKYNIILFSTG
jgi:hypothetical protein